MGNQVKELIEGYGIETLTEMLDLLEITGKDPVAWRNFALKYKIIKKTTKTITPRLRKQRITTRYQSNEDGVWGMYDIEPYDMYNIALKNGRGQYVFQATFTNLDIEKWRGKYDLY